MDLAKIAMQSLQFITPCNLECDKHAILVRDMPAGYAHLMITEQALKAYSSDSTIDPIFRSNALTSHFVKLGSVGPDYPYLDFFQPNQTKKA
jgi:hypothetical protein